MNVKLTLGSRTYVMAAAAALVLSGCAGGGVTGSSGGAQTAVVAFNNSLLEAVKVTAPGPTVTSRAMGMTYTAMYDAWAAYDPVAVGTRLGGALRRPASEFTISNKQKAASYAAYTVLVDLFPTQKSRFDAVMASYGYDPMDMGPTDGAGDIGVRAAQAILTYRHADGSNQLGNLGGGGAYKDYTGYTPVNTATQVNDIGHWQPPTFVMPDGSIRRPSYLTPHWGNVKTFAISNPAALRPVAPAAVGTPEFQQQADEILATTANLTDEQKMIAEYWAKGSGTEFPPGQWGGFAARISARDNHSLDDDIKMFFMVGNAVMDAGICCWESKRFYDYVRPITAIRELYRGQDITSWGGPGKGIIVMKGENWLPYQPASFITPPFPEYTSGHSAFSAAAAEVIKRFTGSDSLGMSVTFAPGSSETEPGVTPSRPITLSWATLSEAADQAGISRRYGGIHFEDGDLRSRVLGRSVGAAVYQKSMDYIEGRGTPNP